MSESPNMNGSGPENVLDAALAYMGRGWTPIDLPLNGKAPGRDNWQSERLDEGELRTRLDGPRNLGLLMGEPSDGLVNVDLDSPEAVALADHFLPRTDLVSGRESVGKAHRWYVCPEVETKKFQALKSGEGSQGSGGEMILEIRSTGSQTVVPPSVHPCGERYSWFSGEDDDPAGVKAKDLVRACRELATAALIARHVPDGGRHDLALALAGFLLRPGRLGRDTVLEILRAAWDTAGYPSEAGKERHEAHRDLEALVVDTLENIEAGEETVGGPTLDEHIPGAPRDISRFWGWTKKEKQPSGEPEESQSQALVRLAGDAELFHDREGEAFATVPVNDHPETHRIRDKGFRNWLRYRFYRERSKPPSSQPLQDAVEVLAARAEFEGGEREVHTRLAGYGDAAYLFLANDSWEVVEITPEGWSIRPASECPVRFHKPRGMFPLPRPERGGSLTPLYDLLNFEDQQGRALVASWAVGALRPTGPYTILILQGEQGTAKSSAARALRSVLDPNKVPLREIPREGRDLAIAAINGWVIAYDNISHLSPWLSDALCRVSTGGGFATRALYTDNGEALFSFMRPTVLNGIADVATRPDLLDRSLLVELPVIEAKNRRTDAALNEDIERMRPGILGALLDGVSVALRNLDATDLPEKPRMADAYQWSVAAAEGLGFNPEDLTKHLLGADAESQQAALTTDPVAEAVLAFMGNRRAWEGTPTELHDLLTERISASVARSKAWPQGSNTLTPRLRRLAPALRKQGLDFESGKGSGRKYNLRWQEGRGPTKEEIEKAREEARQKPDQHWFGIG